MKHLTRDRPKPLISVGGMALIDHALNILENDLITKRVVNVHYLHEMMRNHLADRGIVFSDETDELLETGGGLRRAIPLLGSSPVVTINSDAVWGDLTPLETLMSSWTTDKEALLLVVPTNKAIGHIGGGAFDLDAGGRLRRGNGFVFTGLQIIRTERFETVIQHNFSTRLVWEQMLKAGGLFGTVYHGKWCDVGRPECVQLAESMIKEL